VLLKWPQADAPFSISIFSIFLCPYICYAGWRDCPRFEVCSATGKSARVTAFKPPEVAVLSPKTPSSTYTSGLGVTSKTEVNTSQFYWMSPHPPAPELALI
jgi:hypothetical protein